MKTLAKTTLAISTLLISGLISTTAFAQTSTEAEAMTTMSPVELTYADALQKQVHVLCHVTKGPRVAVISDVELTVTNGKATVAVSHVKADHTRQTKTFADRDWSVTESYDDYSNQIQYEALVNLTDDAQDFLLVQFYSSNTEARGVLQVGTTAYDLICR